MGTIKMVIFDPVGKNIEVNTREGEKLIIGFTREIYFDIVLKIAMMQRNITVDYSVIEEILKELNNRVKGLSIPRQKEYGKLTKPKSFENYWQMFFQNKGNRKYTLIKENPSKLSDERIQGVLAEIFKQSGRKETSAFELVDRYAKILLPERLFKDKTVHVGAKESHLGEQKVPFFICVVDTEVGLSKKDIRMSFFNERVSQPPEIEKNRLRRLEERKSGLRTRVDPNEQIPWPGPTYSIESFSEDRSSLLEHSILSLKLRPTDYFTFLAVQEAIKKPGVRDETGREWSLSEKYLAEYNPFVAIPELAQSISGTIMLICQEGGKPYTLLAKRSKKVATGTDVYVLAVNETPKRRPNPEEMEFLEDVPSHLIKPDLDERGNPCIFRAIVRGAREELGIDLPIETIKLLSFGLETNRYHYVFIGIAETDLSMNQVKVALNVAKDKPFEYLDMFFVPFTPEDIYEFMRTHREWGPEAEIGLFQGLIYKHGSERVQKLFKDYPRPVLGISPAI